MATVARRGTSPTPSRSRNGLEMKVPQRCPRTAFLWETTVKTSKSSWYDGGVIMRQERIFAALPRFSIQNSPGLAAAIFGFLLVHLQAHGCGRYWQKLPVFSLLQFEQTAAPGRPLVVRQSGQFRKNLNRTHGLKLTRPSRTGKLCFGLAFSGGWACWVTPAPAQCQIPAIYKWSTPPSPSGRARRFYRC